MHKTLFKRDKFDELVFFLNGETNFLFRRETRSGHVFIYLFWLLDKSVATENLYQDRTPLSRARPCRVRAPALSCARLGHCRRTHMSIVRSWLCRG